MRSRRPWRIVRTAMMAVVVATGAAVVLPAPAALADAAGQGGDYVPLTRTQRVLDTGRGIGAPKATIGAAGVVTFQVTGVGRIPATGVGAVLVDITTRAPTANTWLTVWPGDVASRPGVGNLNVMAKEILSNSAVVEVGANGKLSVFNHAGKTDLTVDVQGYFTRSSGESGPGGFVPVPSNPTVVTGTIAANATRTVNVLGGVVPAGSPAIFAEVQVVNATAAGWLGTQPTGGPGNDSTMEFVAGTNSHGAVLRPAADGRLNIVNYSSAQISIVVRLQGYFAASNTTGAGLRPLIRRLSDTTIQANDTLDLAVGGTNGLPLKGVASVALNFMTYSATRNGYLKAWPLGSPEPAGSVNAFGVARSRSGMAIIKPGFEGVIRVKNVSGGSVRVFIDLQGWFADPLPTVPPAQFSRTTVVQPPGIGSALGKIEYAYVNNAGRVWFGNQANPDNFTGIQWSEPPSTTSFTGQPGASAYRDGRVQVTVQHSDGDFWAASQKSVTDPTYKPWVDLGGSMTSTPTQITLSTGVVLNFGIDSDGKLWHHRNIASFGSHWRSLGDQDLIGPVSFAPVQQGIQIFARDMSGSVRTVLYANDGSIGVWRNLNAVGVNDQPAVVAFPGSRVRIFVRAGDGTVLTKMQDLHGTWPDDWTPVGTFTKAVGAPAAILDYWLGRVAVVVRGTDNEIYRVFETLQGSGAWGDWQPVSEDGSDPMATDPTVVPVTLGSGQSWLIVCRDINDTTRVWERRIDNGGLRANGSQAAKNAAVPSFTAHQLPAPPAD